MKLKERIKSVGFWVGIISAVFLALGAFGVEIGDDTASAVINAVCSLLVMLGIISAPPSSAERAARAVDELLGVDADDGSEEKRDAEKEKDEEK